MNEMNLPAYTSWEFAMNCEYCKEYLTHRQYHDNKGMCFYCGQLSRLEILPDVVKSSRRKLYTDGRQLAIKAQKLRKSNVVVRLFARLVSKFRKKKRPFVWEYKDRIYDEKVALGKW